MLLIVVGVPQGKPENPCGAFGPIRFVFITSNLPEEKINRYLQRNGLISPNECKIFHHKIPKIDVEKLSKQQLRFLHCALSSAFSMGKVQEYEDRITNQG